MFWYHVPTTYLLSPLGSFRPVPCSIHAEQGKTGTSTWCLTPPSSRRWLLVWLCFALKAWSSLSDNCCWDGGSSDKISKRYLVYIPGMSQRTALWRSSYEPRCVYNVLYWKNQWHCCKSKKYHCFQMVSKHLRWVLLKLSQRMFE